MVTVARVAIQTGEIKDIPAPGLPLLDAYKIDPPALIKAAEDFTISINTVSRSLFEQYKTHYKAGSHGNDFFAVMSATGLGDERKPTLRLHLLDHINTIADDWTTLWAENIEVVEDFEIEQRVFISFHAFCQSLGGNHNRVFDSLSKIFTSTRAIFPALAPLTGIGQVAVEGVNRLLKKKLEIEHETQHFNFAWYPTKVDTGMIPGEAPFQTGAYIFFLEKTNFSDLKLKPDGTVENAQSPYIVVNVKRGIVLAPEQIDGLESKLNTIAGAKVLGGFQANYGYPLSENAATIDSLDALEEFGRSYRLGQQMTRYFNLKAKSDRTTEEKDKMVKLFESLNKAIPEFDSGVV